jgi:hypothetical protein
VVRPGRLVVPVEAAVYSFEKGKEVMVAKAMSTMAAVDHDRLQRPVESS